MNQRRQLPYPLPAERPLAIADPNYTKALATHHEDSLEPTDFMRRDIYTHGGAERQAHEVFGIRPDYVIVGLPRQPGHYDPPSHHVAAYAAQYGDSSMDSSIPSLMNRRLLELQLRK